MHTYLHMLFVKYYDVAELFLLNKSTKDANNTIIYRNNILPEIPKLK